MLGLRLPHPGAWLPGHAVTKKHQVRLDADVAEALGRDAERKGTSLNVAANTWLRRGLGLRTGGGDRTPAADTVASPAPKAQVVPARSTASATCPHPANRRIGPHCGACGATFKAKPGPRL